jgi:sodium-dependent dicarboxylate transporter 2/3/5
MIGVLLWMLIWWMTQVVPIGITSLLPMILFPLVGIQSISEVSSHYANPIIYLFFGGFVLGIAIEKWNLHRRVALNILHRSGSKTGSVVFGAMLATALLSTLISNTATSIMMLPIGMSIIALLAEKSESDAKGLALPLLLGIAISANIGGMTTLIGTPPNLVLAGLIEEAGLGEIGFTDWLVFALPLVIILFTTAFYFLKLLFFRGAGSRIDGMSGLIGEQLGQIGKMNSAEKRVALMVVIAATAWILRRPISHIPGFENLSDTGIALITAVLLFIIPSGQHPREALMEWKDMTRLPWGILLLFGGGISIASGMETTQVVDTVGQWISSGNWGSAFAIIAVITLFAVFLTEAMSNVALVSVFIPVSFVVAAQTNLPELTLAVPLTLGASCAFMFPISTPPNAVVFSSGKIPMKTMAKTGLGLNLLAVIIIAVYSYFFGF